MKLSYITGDATTPAENTMICHICNDVGAWGAGFVLAISNRYGHDARRTFQNPPVGMRNEAGHAGLGVANFVQMRPSQYENLWVVNMVAQKGVVDPGDKIDYEALEKCLHQVNQKIVAFGCNRLQMPRIGCGLAGSSWDKILPLIEKHITADVEVVVYDFEPVAKPITA